MHGVLLLPGGRLHLLEAGAHHDLHVLAAEPARGAAAVHRGVAAAEHDDPLADAVDVAEGDAGEPVDADVDVLGRFLAAGNVEIAAARRAAADEDGVEAFTKSAFDAVDALAADEGDAEVEDVTAFLVEHAFRQAEFWDLRAHDAARERVLIEHHAVIAHRGKVARHRERGRAAAHECDALAVFRPPSWTSITQGRSTAPSITWGATLTATSHASPSGTSPVWRRRCCRCLQRNCRQRGATGNRRVRDRLRDGLRRGPQPQARPVPTAARRSVPSTRPLRAHGPQRRRFHLDLPPAVRRGRRPRRRRRCTHPGYRSELLRRLGGEMAPSACRGGWRRERAPGGDACGQPCFHPAQPSGGGGKKTNVALSRNQTMPGIQVNGGTGNGGNQPPRKRIVAMAAHGRDRHVSVESHRVIARPWGGSTVSTVR